VDKLRQLLGRITELSDEELHELRDSILTEFDAMGSDPERVHSVNEAETLEAIAAAAETVRGEVGRREDAVMRAHDASRVLASFRPEPIKVAARVPDDRLPMFGRVTQGRAHALTASGMELTNGDDFAQEFLAQLRTYQGTRGTHGDKILVASMKADRGPDRTSILIFGNLMQRAYLKSVQRVMDLATAFHAKIAEQQLLTQIGALSTAVSGTAGDLGATRVLLSTLDRAATGMRNRLRMPSNAVLQLICPTGRVPSSVRTWHCRSPATARLA
jgi:hypothetical protein